MTNKQLLSKFRKNMDREYMLGFSSATYIFAGAFIILLLTRNL